MNKSILTKVGEGSVTFFEDRESYPQRLCNIIEDLVSCNKQNLSKYGGSGSIAIKDNGDTVVELTIEGGTSRMSDEGKSIVVVRSQGGNIRSNAYYGKDCNLDFVHKSEIYSLDGVYSHTKAIKDFVESWVCEKGEISAIVVIVDRLDVFRKILSDDFFKDMYILYSE